MHKVIVAGILALFIGLPIDQALATPNNTVASTTTISKAQSGIEAQALHDPVFGNPPSVPVPPIPIAGIAIVAYGTNGIEVARATTDSSGNFKLPLAAGTYNLKASYQTWMLDQQVTVQSGQWLRMQLFFRYTGLPVP
jgi:hypothetical protein